MLDLFSGKVLKEVQMPAATAQVDGTLMVHADDVTFVFEDNSCIKVRMIVEHCAYAEMVVEAHMEGARCATEKKETFVDDGVDYMIKNLPVAVANFNVAAKRLAYALDTMAEGYQALSKRLKEVHAEKKNVCNNHVCK